jgi:hypothetical protein
LCGLTRRSSRGRLQAIKRTFGINSKESIYVG